jgi:hypothetical protein
LLVGFRRHRDYARAQTALLTYPVYGMGGRTLALQSATNYRLLRQRGVTVRQTSACLIATFVIAGYPTIQGHRTHAHRPPAPPRSLARQDPAHPRPAQGDGESDHIAASPNMTMFSDFWTFIQPLDGQFLDALDGTGTIVVVWTNADLVALSLDGTDAYNVLRTDLAPFFDRLTQTGVLHLADLAAAFGAYGAAIAALLAEWPGVAMAEDGAGLRAEVFYSSTL